MIDRALEKLRLTGAAGALVAEVKRHRSDLINQREGRPRSTRVVQRVPHTGGRRRARHRRDRSDADPSCEKQHRRSGTWQEFEVVARTPHPDRVTLRE